MTDNDLPLLSNINDIRARHYLIDLQTKVSDHVFQGKVIIFFETTTFCEKEGKCCTRDCFCSSNTEQEPHNCREVEEECDSPSTFDMDNIKSNFEVILDCCHLRVKRVTEVVCTATDVSEFLCPKYLRNHRSELDTWYNKKQSPLEFSVDKWCIKISKPGVLHAQDFPKVVCIEYETSPHGKSVLWRNDLDGNLCVFTPAASINNRSLLPCQDPPSAMATWQSWITVPQGYYVSMTGDVHPVKFISSRKTTEIGSLIGDHSLQKSFMNAKSVTEVKSLLDDQSSHNLCIKDKYPLQGSLVRDKSSIQDSNSTKMQCKETVQNDTMICYYYFTTMVLPIATIAIAIGKWNMNLLSSTIQTESEENTRKWESCKSTRHKCNHYEYPCHLNSTVWKRDTQLSMVYSPSVAERVKPLGNFLSYGLEAAVQLLGTYPCQRLEVVILPRSFGSLGLASPNLIFLSPTVAIEDYAAFIRLVHEISHAWFGINIGAQDWTEEWISEGFATYMEDSVFMEAVLLNEETQIIAAFSTPDAEHTLLTVVEGNTTKLNRSVLEELSDLRAHLRYRTLRSELENSSEDLQMMRPMQGENLVTNGISFVKDGLNPEKTFLQVHYLKGYFLLKYLSKGVGRKKFDALLKAYVKHYHGQLVLTEDILNFFINMCPEFLSQGITLDYLYENWFHQPGLNDIMKDTYGTVSNSLVLIVQQHHQYWKSMNNRPQNKSPNKKIKIQLEDFRFPDQLVLLLEYLLEIRKIHVPVLNNLFQHYKIKDQNADIRHRWCELAVKHNFSDLSEVEKFMVNDQSMGVYLYGELIISRKAKHRKLAEKVFSKTEKDMDDNTRLTVIGMLFGK